MRPREPDTTRPLAAARPQGSAGIDPVMPEARGAPAMPSAEHAAPAAMPPGSHPERADGGQLAPLFAGEASQRFRARWDAAQASFVDDPRRAVQQADELVGEVMGNLTDIFTGERQRLESQMRDGRQPSTEDLRLALRRYRSFFDRLLRL